MAWYWIVLLAVVFFGVLPVLLLTAILYCNILVRTSKKKWKRDVSMPDDPEYVAMYHEGLKWGEAYASHIREVETKNGKYRLAGQYFDFGGDCAAIILPGRTEGCFYGYCFAEPYRAAGLNVLVVDNRAHGESDGCVNSLGYKEYGDILAWGRFLHDELGVQKVYLHGVCIGASTALFALTAPDCPDYFCGMTADGMYVSFSESFKNHMYEMHRPLFPFFYLTMAYIRIFSGANVVTDGPRYRIGKLRKPILMIHSREDIYSLPALAEELYQACGAKEKKLVWFAHGGHSRVRCNATQKYDSTIQAFLSEHKISNVTPDTVSAQEVH